MLRYKDDIFTRIYFPGKPVVFLHAFPVNHKMWRPQMEFLQDKGTGFFAVDYSGFGQSTLIKREMMMDDYAEDVYELLREMDINRAIFVGLSMGGYVALALYKNHPDIFCGLLLANTRATADLPQAKKKRYDTIESLKKTLDLTPIIDSHIIKFFTEESRTENPDVVKEAEALMHESTVAGVIQALQAMAERPDSRELLKRMNFSVSVTASEADRLVSRAEVESMAGQIPGARFHLIKNAAHLSNLEQPVQFNRILWDLIQRCG